MGLILDRILPIKTVSEANSSEHWAVKGKRHKLQKRWIKLSLNLYRLKIPLPCKIKLTRIAPRKLDEGDNLPTAFKYIRDALSELITGETIAGRSDNDERISWEYSQEKGDPKKYSIRIEIMDLK